MRHRAMLSLLVFHNVKLIAATVSVLPDACFKNACQKMSSQNGTALIAFTVLIGIACPVCRYLSIRPNKARGMLSSWPLLLAA